MIIIALYGKKQPVTIYPSNELATLQYPEIPEEDASRETLFHWDKLEKGEKVNRDVIINRDKFKMEETVIDKEVHFQHREQDKK